MAEERVQVRRRNVYSVQTGDDAFGRTVLAKDLVNGIQSVDKDLLAVVSGTVLNRNIQNAIRNRRARTYIFQGLLPPSA